MNGPPNGLATSSDRSPALLGRVSRYSGLAALLCLVAGIAAPLPGVSPLAQRALGVALFAAVAWTGRSVPLEFSSLVVLLVLPATGVLTLGQAFAAFSGPAVWLVFAGMVLSHMLLELEMGRAVAGRLVGLLAGGPMRLLVGLHLVGLGSAFLVPSAVVRVLLLLPVAEAVAAQLGAARDSRLRTTIILSLVCSTYFGGSGILTGGVPNLVVVGQFEACTGVPVFWSEWLSWMFPIIGLARTGLCLAVIWFLHGRHLAQTWEAAACPPGPRWDQRRRVSLAILAAGVLLWATDALHHLPPVYVGLALVLLCILPRWGPLPAASLRRLNFPFLLYLAALFAVGDAIHAAGVGEHLVSAGARLVGLDTVPLWARYLAVTGITLPLDFLMDIAAVAGVTTPLMLDLAASHGMTPMATAMSVAMATTVVFLPYQSAPFMVALEEGRLHLGDLVVAMLAISILSVLLLCPLNVAYWSWMGWL